MQIQIWELQSTKGKLLSWTIRCLQLLAAIYRVYQIMTLFGRMAYGYLGSRFGIAPNVQSTAGIFQFGCGFMGWCSLFVCRTQRPWQLPMLKTLFQPISTCSQICVNALPAVSGQYGLNTAGRVGSEGFLVFP